MLSLRRNTERHHVQREKSELWPMFYPQERPNPSANDFRDFGTFNEMRLSPGGVVAARPREEAELLTYVYTGALAQEDSTGSSGVVLAGEFQHMTTGRGIRYKETNASDTDWAHIFRISLRPSEVGLARAHEQKRFVAAQRHNTLCVVASLDGRKGSLRVNQDALIYSSVLDPGHHLIHELLTGRSAWLHIVSGEATLQNLVLTQGDGVGVSLEPSVSLTARENTEILLVDVGPQSKRFARRHVETRRPDDEKEG